MRKLTIIAAALAGCIALPAAAQDTAPDGSRAFGLEPYFGVTGAYEVFDNQSTQARIPRAYNADGSLRHNYRLAGGSSGGVIGANLPLKAFFVGAEANISKGFAGNIDYEYGAAGRAGLRVGDSGLFYGKAGYEWVKFSSFAPGSNGDTRHHYGDGVYGIGMEVGPKDIGLGALTGNHAGLRLRGEVQTYGAAKSLRPSLGLIAHF